ERAPAAGDLPLLAYVHRPGSFDALALRDAARGVCRLLWVVDTSLEGVAGAVRLLDRLGEVVDVAGRAPADAAALVAAHRPAGVLTLADAALVATADLAERLGLAFHTPDVARRLTDKHAQREALAAAGLRVPVVADVPVGPDGEDLEVLARRVSLPAVLKPRVGEGSLDTFLVDSVAELGAAVAEARASDATRALVLESYIPDAPTPLGGQGFAGYLSVESVVAGGPPCHLATNGRLPPAPPFRETGFFIPSAVAPPLLDEVLEVASAAIVALGVTTGCLHTEVKLTADGPVVIEVNGRVGGGVPEMLHRACGVDLLALAMRVALGERPACGGLLPVARLAFLVYVHAPEPSGVVTSVEGMAEVRAAPGVDEVVLRRVPGDRVDWREGNHGHVLSVLGTAEDHDGLRAMRRYLDATLRIEVS
ncbi:MAG TPA: ATP-grasp domain-containing protein, partial [Acidimicrobiales bacterium]|nr:ATP-grasp domain-containing protein [Acidimicrobiales bacterium]